MLHRFPDPELGNKAAHDVGALRNILSYLRRNNFELLGLSAMFERAAKGDPLSGAIAFTIDDGYRDHASIGAPLFAEFDCPVTTFVTSGFLDGTIWFWWDKIDYAFAKTKRTSLTVSLSEGAPPLTLQWAKESERDAARDVFTIACKAIPEEKKQAAIASLAGAAEVEIPVRAPGEFSPMSWSDARRCEAAGMTFGPHTVTHPILARVSDAQSQFEIEESWRRLGSEVAHPVPVFCYPNGQPSDFGEREMRTLTDLGLQGAVVGSAGYATGAEIRAASQRFCVRRFAMSDERTDVIQYVTGLERAKERLRRARG